MKTRRLRIAGLLCAIALVPLLAVACGSDDNSAKGPVNVTLRDHTIDTSRSKTPAGPVTFDITNEGPSEHEFVVVKTDLAPDSLPRDEEGAFDEQGAGVDFIDERENIALGDHVTLSLNLEPGNYVLLCNLEDHYKMGMYTSFQVT